MKIQAISSAVAISTMLLSGAAFAAEESSEKVSSPKVFGTLNVGATKVPSKTDIDGTAIEASLGVKGGFKKEGLNLRYRLEAEFTNAVNDAEGKDELEIKTAVVALPTNYGLFVVAARGESAQQREMYKPVDLFEVNEADSVHGLWQQPDEASSVFAYVTPKFNNTHFAIAALTLSSDVDAFGKKNINHNDEDADAIAMRLVHNGENLYLGAGLVIVSDKQVPTDEDYYRSTLSAGYNFNGLKLGAVWENNADHPAGGGNDMDVVSVAADYQIDQNWSVGAAYIDRNSDFDALDDDGAIAIVRRRLFEDAFAYAEVADYDVRDDNYTIGVKVNF